MFNGLKKLLGNSAHNIATNAQGVYNQINLLDKGKTFADAWRHPLPITSQLGHWSGIKGGDQEFIPTHNVHPVTSTVYPNTAPLLHVAPPALQQLLSVGNSNQLQPSYTPEDSLNPAQYLQNLSYNNGQITNYGGLIQGPMNIGVGYPTGISLSQPSLPSSLPGTSMQLIPDFNNRRGKALNLRGRII